MWDITLSARIVQVLSRNLGEEGRKAFQSKLLGFRRDLTRQMSRDSNDLIIVKRHGWTTERLDMVIVLAAFYQTVVHPIEFGAPSKSVGGLGEQIPIHVGSTTIDSRSSHSIHEMVRDFWTMIKKAQIPTPLLSESDVWHMLRTLASSLEADS